MPGDFRPSGERERVGQIRYRGIGLSLPTFPVPPNDQMASHAVVRVSAMFTISHIFGKNKRKRLLQRIRLVTRPKGVYVADMFRVLIRHHHR